MQHGTFPSCTYPFGSNSNPPVTKLKFPAILTFTAPSLNIFNSNDVTTSNSCVSSTSNMTGGIHDLHTTKPKKGRESNVQKKQLSEQINRGCYNRTLHHFFLPAISRHLNTQLIVISRTNHNIRIKRAIFS